MNIIINVDKKYDIIKQLNKELCTLYVLNIYTYICVCVYFFY